MEEGPFLETHQPRLALYCFIYTFISFLSGSGRFKVGDPSPSSLGKRHTPLITVRDPPIAGSGLPV